MKKILDFIVSENFIVLASAFAIVSLIFWRA